MSDAAPAGLLALVEALRRDGFRAGPAETVAAGRLLARLAAQRGAPQSADALRPWLRPIFCSSPEEQARFDAVYAPWAQGFDKARAAPAAPSLTAAAAPPGVADAAAAAGAALAAAQAAQQARRLRALQGAMLIALLLVLGVWVWLARAPVPNDAPATPPVTTATTAPVVTPAATAPAATATASAPALQGYFPALTATRTLRPALVWGLLLPPLAVLLLAGAVPGLSLMQGRRRHAQQVALDMRTLAQQAREVLPPLASAVAGRLERHVRAGADGDGQQPPVRRLRIDARRTVEALLRRPGRLDLHWRGAPVRPSYLVLIDAQDEDDPRGRLFYLWAERLQREGLRVDILLFARPGADGSGVPMCWPSAQRRAGRSGVPIDRLETPPAGQRLVVVSDAATWVADSPSSTGAATGRAVEAPDWQDWFLRARLHRWPQRAFFTTLELRDWGPAEDAIETPEHAADPGFLVLPLDEAALDAWSELLVRGSLPRFALREPQGYPRVLSRAGHDAYREPDASPAGRAELDRLIAQLKLYLGDTGFRWLAALAVPPLVRWELTLLLGRALFQQRQAQIGDDWRDILGRGYRRLARLPWMRSGGADADGRRLPPRLPDWLRLRLLDELPPRAHDEIREVVDALLSQLQPDAAGSLPLGFEAPPRAGQALAGAGDATGDALYLGTLSGLTPRQLALRLPGGWQAWLRQRPPATDWPGRLRRWGALLRDLAQAGAARLVFRRGLPWAGRSGGALVVALAWWGAAGIALWQLARWPAAEVSPAVAGLLWQEDTRPVIVPGSGTALATALSADGRRGLSLLEGGRVLVWDTADGRVLQRLDSGVPLLNARFDDSGRVLACGPRALWIGPSPADAGATSGAVKPSGAPRTMAVTTCLPGPTPDTLVLYDDVSRQALLFSPGNTVGRLFRDADLPSLSPNGRWMLVRTGNAVGRSGDPLLTVWDVAGDRATSSNFRPLDAAASPGDRYALAWHGDTVASLSIGLRGVPMLQQRRLPDGQTTARGLEAEPDGAQPGAGPVGAGAKQANPASEANQANQANQANPAPPGDAAVPLALARSADGRTAVVALRRGAAVQLETWSLPDWRRVQRRELPATETLAATLSADASALLVSQPGKPQQEVSLAQAWLPPLERSVAGGAVAVAMSADGRRAAYAAADGLITLLDTAPGAGALWQKRAPMQPELLALSADGRQLAASGDGVMAVWLSPAASGAAGDAIVTYASGSPLSALVFTDSGELLGAARDGALMAMAPDAGTGLRTTGEIIPPPNTLAIGRNGVVAGIDRDGRLWLKTPRSLMGRGDLRRVALTVPVDAANPVYGITVAGAQVWVGAGGKVWSDTVLGTEPLKDLLRNEPRPGIDNFPPRHLLDGNQVGASLAVDAGSGSVAVVTTSGQLQLFRALDGRLGRAPDGRDGVRSVRWLDGNRLLVAERSGLAQVWNLAAGEPEPWHAPLDLRGDPGALEVSADSRHAVTLARAAVPAGVTSYAAQAALPAAALPSGEAGVWALPQPPPAAPQPWLPRLPLVPPAAVALVMLLLATVGMGLLQRRHRQRLRELQPLPPAAPALGQAQAAAEAGA